MKKNSAKQNSSPVADCGSNKTPDWRYDFTPFRGFLFKIIENSQIVGSIVQDNRKLANRGFYCLNKFHGCIRR